MVKTKAGSEVDEELITNALMYPIGASEPNTARNGEEWLLQRDGRGRGLGAATTTTTTARSGRGVFITKMSLSATGIRVRTDSASGRTAGTTGSKLAFHEEAIHPSNPPPHSCQSQGSTTACLLASCPPPAQASQRQRRTTITSKMP